ncbi:MAG: hypothetical protein IKA43_06860 [Clostridia bacterium]|nr:hypothetical protein [Clostridia bacterium]
MEIFKTLIGNNEIKKTLGSAIASSSFSHAYIIEGAQGTGKRLIATLASAGIFCSSSLGRPCMECTSCKRVLDGIHTDVRYFEITKVDQVREIKQGLYDAPNESDFKIYIFENAHKMNIKAQNALLISLEEPPKNVIFFLLTTDAGALLETIRSRAQILRTELLDGEVIFKYLKENLRFGMNDEALREIVVASCGSLGYAIDLTDEKKALELIERRKSALDFTLAVIKNDAYAVSLLLSYSGYGREELKEHLSLCLSVIGDIILLKKDKGAPLYFFTSREEALQIAQKHQLGKLMGVYDALDEAISALNLNSNTALTLMSILVNSKKKGS